MKLDGRKSDTLSPTLVERASASILLVMKERCDETLYACGIMSDATIDAIARAALSSAIPEAVDELRAALKWVDQIYPGKNAESGGAIIHMTWHEWNALRVALDLKEQTIPGRASQTVRLIRTRSAEQKGAG